jgi:hypothetical protein
MWSSSSRLALVLAIMAFPSFVEPALVRAGTLLVCLSIAVLLVWKWFVRGPREQRVVPPFDPAGRSGGTAPRGTLPRGLVAQGETVHRLTHQLREVVQQTEQAALEINGRVINIIGRARKQLQSASAVVQDVAQGRANGGAAREQALAAMIEAMADETAQLSADVNSVIMSLQFQDVTKQRLEHVIEQLQQLRQDLESLKTHPAGGTGTAGGRAGAPAA